MKISLPYIDRIWRVRSSVSIDEQMSCEEGFERMSPLFRTNNTEAVLDGDTLTYSKSNPAAQDRLATFTSGTLRLREGKGRTTLYYDVRSTALLLCFLAPLLFLALGGAASFLNTIDPVIEDPAKKAAEEARENEMRELHWFDQMMGVPAPDPKGEEGGDADEDKEDEKHNPIPAYVLAGIFSAIYLVGRILEPYLLKRTFRTALNGGYIATPMGAVRRDRLDAYTEEAIPRATLDAGHDREGSANT